MENTNTLSAPKTVSADTKVSPSEAVITSNVRFTCDAVVNFENRIKSESCPIVVDRESGRRVRVFPKGGIQGLMEGAQSYYDRALLAESKCEANLKRALLAESKNKNSLYGGLVGGLVIGAGVVGLFFHIRKRREKRQKGNK